MSGDQHLEAISRRVALARAGKAFTAIAGATALAPALAACGSDSGSAAGTATGGGGGGGITAADVKGASGTMNILGTETYKDAAADPAGVNVKWGFSGSNDEILSKTAQEGTFDAVSAFHGAVDQLDKLGRLEPIDTSLISEWDSINPLLRDSDAIRRRGEVYAIPHHWGYVYTAYNTDKLERPTSFEDLMAPELKKKVGMPDDPYAVITTFAAFAGARAPNLLSREEFDKTFELLKQFKPQLLDLHQYGEEGQLFGRGDIWVGVAESANTVLLAREAGVKADYTIDFGSWSWFMTYLLLKGAKNPAAAYAYFDKALSPEAQRALTKKSEAFPVVAAADGAIPKAFAYDDATAVLEKAPLQPGVPLEENDAGAVTYQEWLAAWDQFKAS